MCKPGMLGSSIRQALLAFNRDTRHRYIPMQRSLSSDDAMMEYIGHTGSAHLALPPGPAAHLYWGEALSG